MNGRILHGVTPSKRISAAVLSVLTKKWVDYRTKHPSARVTSLYLEEFIDYADLEQPLTTCLEREEFIIRLDEHSLVQDRFRKQVLKDKLQDSVKKINDLRL